MVRQARVYVKGDVVGVGFRAWVKIQLKPLGVNGWVRNVFNKPDVFGPYGGVEVLLQVPDRILQDAIDHIRPGSPISRVDDVDVFYENPVELFQEFTIRKSEAYSREE